MTTIIRWAAVATMAVVALSACSSRMLPTSAQEREDSAARLEPGVGRSSTVDMPRYAWLDQLAAESLVVLEGDVTSVIGTEEDNPDPDLTGGPVVEIVEVAVSKVLRGDSIPSRIVVVATLWPGTPPPDELNERLQPGTRVALFLTHRAGGSPGITLAKDFFVPNSGGYGVFELRGSEYVSRSDGFLGLTEGQPLGSAPGRLVVEADAFQAVVTSTVAITSSGAARVN